jgi:hypothetical protein
LSSCSQKLLEKKGLALGGLGVVGINIGLGGKRWTEFPNDKLHAKGTVHDAA